MLILLNNKDNIKPYEEVCDQYLWNQHRMHIFYLIDEEKYITIANK
jgi:hypothetical protein